MKLADYLAANNVSPTDFARRIGTPASTITRFLAGTRGLGLGIALRIETHTQGQVRPDELRPAQPEASAAA